MCACVCVCARACVYVIIRVETHSLLCTRLALVGGRSTAPDEEITQLGSDIAAEAARDKSGWSVSLSSKTLPVIAVEADSRITLHEAHYFLLILGCVSVARFSLCQHMCIQVDNT